MQIAKTATPDDGARKSALRRDRRRRHEVRLRGRRSAGPHSRSRHRSDHRRSHDARGVRELLRRRRGRARADLRLSVSAASARSSSRPMRSGFGRLLSTPKPGWSGTDVLAPLRSAFAAPIALDTDVGAAALAEWRIGAGRGVGSLAYVTVGTGIGGAVVPHDATVRRLMHAEMGHLRASRDPRDRRVRGRLPVSPRLHRGPRERARDPRALGLRSRRAARGSRRAVRHRGLPGAARRVDRAARIGRAHRARRRRDVERGALAARERGNARVLERLPAAARRFRSARRATFVRPSSAGIRASSAPCCSRCKRSASPYTGA